MHLMRHRPFCVGIALSFLVLDGCASVGPYRAKISSEEAAERILGIRAAGQAKDWGAVPLIVDRLEDEDEAVRFYAILALERITGERMGYDYSQSSYERSASVSRWRAYVKGGKHLTAAAATESEAASQSNGHPGA